MIDIRTGSLVNLLPDSIADDPDVLALSLALDPEMRLAANTVAKSIVLPNLDNCAEAVLNAVADGMRLSELAVWDHATVAGKRAVLCEIFKVRRRSGTPYTVRQIFALLELAGQIVEWWQPFGSTVPFTYRIVITLGGVTPIALWQLLAINEWRYRFGRPSTRCTQILVTTSVTGSLFVYPYLTAGRFVTIPFGGP